MFGGKPWCASVHAVSTYIAAADSCFLFSCEQLITGLAAAAVGLPGLLLGRMPIAARVLWRALAYGSPAAYVAAAVGTRLLVRRIKVRLARLS